MERSDETVAAFRDGLNEARLIRRVAKGLTQPGDCAVQPVVEINKGVGGPEALPQLIPCNQVARTFQEQGQNAKWLFL